jgi:phenylacetic acid degradation operon negative regulatory protein
VHPDDPRALVREAFDLDGLAARYRDFIDAWAPHLDDDAVDPLALTLRLSTQWLRMLREVPRVPLQLLPDDWPAPAAEALFRGLHERHRAAARAVADEVLELAPG